MANSELDDAYRAFLDSIGRVEKELAAAGMVAELRPFVDTVTLVKESYPSLGIAGINCLRPVHEGIEAIRNLLRRGGSATIAIGDHKSDRFRERMEIEGDGSIFRIPSELIGTLAGLETIAAQAGMDKSLQVYFQDHIRGSLIIAARGSGEGRMQVNPYSDDVADRGLQSRTYMIGEKQYGEPFEAGLRFYDLLLGNSQLVPLIANLLSI